MAAGQIAWRDLMNVCFGMIGTSLRAGEMMIASGSVVSARMSIMGNAARSPADGDYEEIGGMLQEKLTAFTEVGQAVVDQWSLMLDDTTRQAHHASTVMFSGRPLTHHDLSELSERRLAHGTRMLARTLEFGDLAMAPVHQHAVENARRLA